MRAVPPRSVLLSLFLAASCAPAPSRAPAPVDDGPVPPADSAALVTVLGRDTLALERWVRQGNRVTADVVVRVPRTSLRRYELLVGDDGLMRVFIERRLDPSAPEAGPLRTERLETLADTGDAWRRTVIESFRTTVDTVRAPYTALPWVDLVHWPFELVVGRLAAGSAETAQPLLAGGRVLPFRVRRPTATTAELTHPLRGTTTAELDASGRLLALDAAATTRKTRVRRERWVRVEEAARAWAAADAAGRGMGDLSGRGREEETVGGAKIVVDYGRPHKRGREIFGGIVPWGQLWRTGANLATHLSTDRSLVLGEGRDALAVPPGEYTLFSIPAPDGGVLIVNRQTGQSGTAHDATRDLGRVPMRIGKLPEVVEGFTIDVQDNGGGRGTINLKWDRAQFTVPFAVR